MSNYLDVLSTQEVLFVVQLDLVKTQGDQLSAFAQMYRALGAGWPVEKKDEKENESSIGPQSNGESSRAPASTS